MHKREYGAKRLDWDALKARLKATQTLAERGFVHDAGQQLAILIERARQLAIEPAASGEEDVEIEILDFSVEKERYAFETAWIREVVVLKELTPIPSTPPFILGIANVRGRVLSIIDIRRFFGLPGGEAREKGNVIVLADETMEFGVFADAIVGVARLRAAALQGAQSTIVGACLQYLKGITPARLIVLDAKRLLAAPEMRVDQEVAP